MRSALLAALLFATTLSASDTEIARLEALVARFEKTELPKILDGALPRYKEALARAKNTHSPTLKAYRLRLPLLALTSMAVVVDRHKESAVSYESMHKLWTEHRAQFEPAKKDPPPGASMLQKALRQAALNRAEKLFAAALPYGKADGPMSGVYYIGEAEGFLAYANFLGTLQFEPDSLKPPSAAAILAAADALDAEALKLFAADPVARTAIPTSALLKETRELVARGWLEGATLTLLEARLELARRQGVKDDGTQSEMPEVDSFAVLFAASAKEDDRGDTAGPVRIAVLPFYKSLATPPPAKTAVKGPVRLTLVRWPYT